MKDITATFFKRTFNLILSMLTLFLLGIHSTSFAQQPKSKVHTDIPALIRKLKDDDENVVESAHQALLKIRPQVIPVAVEMLRNEKKCADRMLAAMIVIDLDPKNQALVPALVEIAKGGTDSSSEDELMCHRSAAFGLVVSPAGIHALTELLKDEDIFVRQSAIFAFDNLTEAADYPEGSLQAMKEAIPVIVRASKDKDQILSEVSNEVLGQIIRYGGKELSDIAKKEMEQNK